MAATIKQFSDLCVATGDLCTVHIRLFDDTVEKIADLEDEIERAISIRFDEPWDEGKCKSVGELAMRMHGLDMEIQEQVELLAPTWRELRDIGVQTKAYGEMISVMIDAERGSYVRDGGIAYIFGALTKRVGKLNHDAKNMAQQIAQTTSALATLYEECAQMLAQYKTAANQAAGPKPQHLH